MGLYVCTVSNAAFSTADDFLTLTSIASRRARVVDIVLSGMGTTSVANSLAVQRSTAGTTPTAQTPGKTVVDQAAAAVTASTAWATDPTLSGNPLLIIGCNANGGVNRWVAAPGEEIEFRNGEQISFRPLVGASNMNLTVVFEEI